MNVEIIGSAKSNFETAIKFVLKNEGGYVNDPKDPGSATNLGISLRFLQSIGELGDINHDGVVDFKDIQDMTVQEATELYNKEFWLPNRYDQIHDVALATKIFDFAVNMGAKRANKLLQEAYNLIKYPICKSLLADGIIGNITIGSINMFLENRKLLTALENNAARYYHSLVAVKPSLDKYLVGWLNRAYRWVPQ